MREPMKLGAGVKGFVSCAIVLAITVAASAGTVSLTACGGCGILGGTGATDIKVTPTTACLTVAPKETRTCDTVGGIVITNRCTAPLQLAAATIAADGVSVVYPGAAPGYLHSEMGVLGPAIVTIAWKDPLQYSSSEVADAGVAEAGEAGEAAADGGVEGAVDAAVGDAADGG